MTKLPKDETWPSGRLMTVKDVAERVQLSERTIHRLISKKHLRVLRIGSALRVTEEAFRELLTGADKP